MRYSLADYIVTIEPNDEAIKSFFGTLSIGGGNSGNCVGSISLSIVQNLWETTGYATGGWVHNKNYDRHGTCSIQINQMSPEVRSFVDLCNHYFSGDYGSVTITVTAARGEEIVPIATCADCYIQKTADQTYGPSAENQNWVFTCGQIVYN